MELKSRDLVVKLDGAVTVGTYALPGPGEYEVGGVMANQTNLLTRLEMEDLVLAVLAPGVSALSDTQIEQIGAIDVLFFHIDPNGGLSPKHVQTLVTQVEAPLVIPIPAEGVDVMGYCTKDMRCETIPAPYKLTRSQLPIDGSKVVVFA